MGDGMGTSDPSPVPNSEVRKPILLTPVLASGHPLNLVLTRAMLVLTVSTASKNQYLLCLSVPSSPLAQDFLRLVSSTAARLEHAAESCPSAPHPGTPFPAVGMEPVPELVLGPTTVDATDASMVAFTTLNVGALGCSGASTACGTGMFGTNGITFIRSVDSASFG